MNNPAYLYLFWYTSYSFKLRTLWHINSWFTPGWKKMHIKLTSVNKKIFHLCGSIYVVCCFIFCWQIQFCVPQYQFIRIKGLLVIRTRPSSSACKYLWFLLPTQSCFFSLQITHLLAQNSWEAVFPYSFWFNWLTHLNLVIRVLIDFICIS